MNKKLFFFFTLIFFQYGSLVGQTNLYFRANNPRIIKTFNSTYNDYCDNLEFDLEVKASNSSYYYSLEFHLTNDTIALSDIEFSEGPLCDNGYYFLTYNLANSNINLSVASTESPTSGNQARFEQITTFWQKLGTFRLRLVDPSQYEIALWINSLMQGQQYEKTFSPNGVQLYAGFTCIGDPFDKLYLGRMYSSGKGWSQIGSPQNDVQYINWSDSVNTSVWDSTGTISTFGCLSNKLRIHTGGKLKIMPNESLSSLDSADINEANGIWIASTSNGSGSFIDNGIITYHNTGSAEVERYLSQDRWHSYCIPVNSTNTHPFLDLQLVAKWYDEPEHRYRSIVDPTGDSILSRIMLGYLVYSNSSLTGNSTIRVTGSLNTGPLSFYMTNHVGPSGPDGWNLIGNPYPSAINWLSNNFALELVDPTIYVFHPEAGNYFYWNRHDQVHTTGASAIIAAQQAFYMHANVAGSQSGNVSMDNSIRLHSTQPFYRSDTLMNEQLILTVSGNNFTDESRIRFDSATSILFEPDHDAYKLDGVDDAPQFYTVLPDSTRVALNARPWGGFNTLIPLGFHIGVESTDTLTASNLESFQLGIMIWVEDKKMNTWINLNQTPQYIFTALPNDSPDRFLLHFSNPYTGLITGSKGIVRVYSFDASVYVMNTANENGPGTIFIYDLIGRLVFKDKLRNAGLNKFVPGINQGTYVVKVITELTTCIQKVYLK